jgi:hypothetical protein
MKKLLTQSIESCGQCPFSTLAELKSETTQANFRYCSKMVSIAFRESPLAMLEGLAAFAVKSQGIPDWCPLEDEQDSADVYAKILKQSGVKAP